VQTKKIKRVPIVLFGKEYWTPLLTHFREDFYERYHAVDEGDLELYHLVDTVDEAYDYIIKNVEC
jgi:predicted Rossmann-fold nucleotide-binding protein